MFWVQDSPWPPCVRLFPLQPPPTRAPPPLSRALRVRSIRQHRAVRAAARRSLARSFTPMPDLVLGAATGYHFDQVSIFARSLRQSGYAGRCVLLIEDDQSHLVAPLRTLDIDPEYYVTGKFIFTKPHTRRFIKFYEWLLNHQVYDRIFLTDVRDVVFQGPPFVRFEAHDLHAFLEDDRYTIGSSAINADWVRLFFGRREYDFLRDRPISCCGTIMGTRKGMLSYLRILLILFEQLYSAESRRRPFRTFRRWRKIGLDTAAHNIVVHHGLVDNMRLVPNNEIVSTMHYLARERFLIRDGKVWNTDNTISPILHQYDRFPELREHFGSLFGSGQ